MQIIFLLQRSRVAVVRALALMLVWVEFVCSLLDIEDQNFSLFVVTWIDLLSSQKMSNWAGQNPVGLKWRDSCYNNIDCMAWYSNRTFEKEYPGAPMFILLPVNWYNFLKHVFCSSMQKPPFFMVKKVTREKFSTYCPDLWEKRQNPSNSISHSRHKRKSPNKQGEKHWGSYQWE